MDLRFSKYGFQGRLGGWLVRSACLGALAALWLGVIPGGAGVRPAHAQGQASYKALQKIGCYYHAGDKRLWVATIALDKKYVDPNFYEEEALSAIIRAGDQKFNIDGKDILVHPMASFDFPGANKYQFMKYSLVIDYSSSIPAGTQADVLNSIDEFITRLPLAIEGQLIRFSDKVEKFPFTSKKSDIQIQLRQPIAYGMTALHDALMEAATSLAQNKANTPVRVLVLFTDGFDTSSQTYKDRTNFISSFVDLVKSEGIVVAVIGVTKERDDALLNSITDRSRGVIGLYVPIEDFDKLRAAFTQIENMFKNTVIFRFPKRGPDRGRAEISLGMRTKGGSFNTFQVFECEY